MLFKPDPGQSLCEAFANYLATFALPVTPPPTSLSYASSSSPSPPLSPARAPTASPSPASPPPPPRRYPPLAPPTPPCPRDISIGRRLPRLLAYASLAPGDRDYFLHALLRLVTTGDTAWARLLSLDGRLARFPRLVATPTPAPAAAPLAQPASPAAVPAVPPASSIALGEPGTACTSDAANGSVPTALAITVTWHDVDGFTADQAALVGFLSWRRSATVDAYGDEFTALVGRLARAAFAADQAAAALLHALAPAQNEQQAGPWCYANTRDQCRPRHTFP